MPDPPSAAAGVIRRFGWFATIGGVTSVVYAALFWVLAGPLGSQAANVVAFTTTTVATTAANRRLTFDVRGSERRWRHQAQGLVLLLVGTAVTSGSLGLLHQVTEPDRPTELVVLLSATAVAGLLRFALFSTWVFPRRVRGTSRAQS